MSKISRFFAGQIALEKINPKSLRGNSIAVAKLSGVKIAK
jgi:hypothetical protein